MKRSKSLLISLLWILLFFGVRIVISIAVSMTGANGGIAGILDSASVNASKVLFLSSLITPVFILLTVKLNGSRFSSAIGLRKAKITGLLVSAALAIVATPVITFLLGFINFPAWLISLYGKLEGIAVFKHTRLSLVTSVVLIPLCEEIVFRGAVYCTLRQAFSHFTSVFASTLLYALVYPDPYQSLFAFVTGLILCFMYIRFDSLWAPLIGHIFFSFVLRYFDINVYRNGLQYGVLALCGAAVLTLIIWMLATGIEELKAARGGNSES